MSWSQINKQRTVKLLSYREACLVVREHHICNCEHFREWSQRPRNIPARPPIYYGKTGEWQGWSEFLGDGYKKRIDNWRPFKEARTFVHSLGLKSTAEWVAYRESGKKPKDIPACPRDEYPEFCDIGDWIGYSQEQRIEDRWRTFKEARAFVQSLGLRTAVEWKAYAASLRRPADISPNPWWVYREEWKGIQDWLGHHTVPRFRPFAEARIFVHSLRFNSSTQYIRFCKSGKCPKDISWEPDNCHQWANDWKGWADYLGKKPHWLGDKIPFEEARVFVRGLKLKSASEYHKWACSGKRPKTIPAKPYKIGIKGAHPEWQGWADWLGPQAKPPIKILPYEEARKYARSLGLKGSENWAEFIRTKQRKEGVPATPQQTYTKQGTWKGWADWLGKSYHSRIIRSSSRNVFLSFKQAKDFVRKLGLTNYDEWHRYTRSKEFPKFLPMIPRATYKEYMGIKDWLGIPDSGRKIHGILRKIPAAITNILPDVLVKALFELIGRSSPSLVPEIKQRFASIRLARPKATVVSSGKALKRVEEILSLSKGQHHKIVFEGVMNTIDRMHSNHNGVYREAILKSKCNFARLMAKQYLKEAQRAKEIISTIPGMRYEQALLTVKLERPEGWYYS